jgi:hypothetical protein
MSKSRKMKPKAHPPSPARAGSRLAWVVVVLVAIALLATGGLWWSRGRQSEVHTAATAPAETQATNTPASSTVAAPALEKLKGRWLRPDGGYVIDVKSVDEATGKLDAGYFNPRSIHVSRAEASRNAGTVKVFLELRDVNYPGSNYTLAYDPATDQLKGIYYQAALGQQFEVYFERTQ